MRTLLEIQRLSSIDPAPSEPLVHSPVLRAQKRIEQRLAQGEAVHDGSRPLSRAVQKLANRYSIDQKPQEKKIG